MYIVQIWKLTLSHRNAQKTLDRWTRASHSSRCPVLLLSAKIRCCHLRNNTLSMWYEVFFWFCWCSLYGLCEVGLFHFWNLEDCLLCVFVFFLFVSVTFRCHSLADDWRGACQSIFLCLFGFKAGSWWKRPPSHPLARLRVGEDLAVGLSVSLPRLCFNMLHFSGNRFSRISPVKKKKKKL